MQKVLNIQNQKGWVDSSTHIGKTEPYLTDSQLWATKVRVYPIKDYILTRYPQEAFDAMDSKNQRKVQSWGPFIFLGIKTVPLAIELSQWGYDASVVVLDEVSKTKVIRDANRQAGLFKKVVVSNYMPGPVPEGSIVFIVDMLDSRRDSDEIREVVDIWLSNHHEIICALPRDRQWRDVFCKKFSVTLIGITDDDIFLSITNK